MFAVLGLAAARAETATRIKLIATRENHFIKCLYLLDVYHFHLALLPEGCLRTT
jgi:hypothetical protein